VMGQEPAVPDRATLVLRPSGDIPEILPDVILARSELTVRNYVELIRKAKTDSRIAGILVRPGGINSPFWAKLQEIRAALEDFKTSGKYVHAWLEYAGDREYYLATVADRIYLLPSTSLDLTGVATYEVFLRGTFDWIGTYPDFLHVGDYKTAVNTYLEKTYTPAHREMSESINRSQYEHLVRTIANARKKPEPEVRALIDQGPFQPADALRVGLIDEVAYEDELDDLVEVLRHARYVEAEDYAQVSWQAAGVTQRSKIAVINAAGVINSGTSGFDPVNGAVVGADSLVEYIREARADRSIRAIVLRVDSPGGSSTASDVIWRELSISRENNRPVIVSMSDLAASGGYYMAMTGDPVIAYPQTQTGSIGVVFGKPNLRGLYEKLGITKDAIDRGRHAGIDSDYKPLTPEERAILKQGIDESYRDFVQKVADARKRKYDEIDPVAQGRVWLGSQAKDRGLVDELGGLETALAALRKKANLGDETVRIVTYPARRSIVDVLMQRSREDLVESKAAAVFGRVPFRAWLRGGFLRIMPQWLTVQ
jgi:protease-4